MKKFLLAFTMATLTIAGCSDDDVQEPTQPESNGVTFSGNISGTRQNGEVFSESFSYSNEKIFYVYTDNINDTERDFDIVFGTNDAPIANIRLKATHLDTDNPTVILNRFAFFYSKELTPTTLFKASIVSNLIPIEARIPLQPALNGQYGFKWALQVDAGDSTAFPTHLNEFVQESNSYENCFETTTPTRKFFLGDLIYSDEVNGQVTSFEMMRDVDKKLKAVPEPYKSLKIVYTSEGASFPYWAILGENNKKLFADISIPADQHAITNFKFDRENGVLSFDISTTRPADIYRGPWANSTEHEAVVTGHIAAKVITVVN